MAMFGSGYHPSTVRALTYHELSRAYSLRALGATICALASFAIFVHHAAPSMDMHGMAGMTETCVSVAAHAGGALAAPAVLLLALAGAALLLPVAIRVVFASRSIGRARAGPPELRMPLRC
jgi:uncharacterized membrane protein YphA (DoxX/SURF4 family)